MTCSPRGAFFSTIDSSGDVANNGYYAPYAQAVSLNSRDGRLLGGMLSHMYPPNIEVARSVADVFASTPDRLFFNQDNYANEFASHYNIRDESSGDDAAQQQQIIGGGGAGQQQQIIGGGGAGQQQQPPATSTDQTPANVTPADTPISPQDLDTSSKSELSGEAQANGNTVDVSTSADPPQTNKEAETFIYNALAGRHHVASSLGKLRPKSNGVYVAPSKRSNGIINKENYGPTELAGFVGSHIIGAGKENFNAYNQQDQNAAITIAIIVIAICLCLVVGYILIHKAGCCAKPLSTVSTPTTGGRSLSFGNNFSNKSNSSSFGNSLNKAYNNSSSFSNSKSLGSSYNQNKSYNSQKVINNYMGGGDKAVKSSKLTGGDIF